MTGESRKVILTKAIRKSRENGCFLPAPAEELVAALWRKSNTFPTMDYYWLLYNHEFAKALWGEELYIDQTFNKVDMTVINQAFSNWQYHLQQMVCSPDPLFYLGEHLAE